MAEESNGADIVIIGKGPAGWSCAITARMRGLRAVVVAPLSDTGWLRRAEKIDNYPGLPSVPGSALLDSFEQQALALGAENRVGLVRQILPNDGSFLLLVENDVLQARAVVLAMGAARPSLLPGEEELIGRGVSYCATCDGMFYRGKDVAVLSTSLQGVEETRFLRDVAKSVTYYQLKPHNTEALPPDVSQSAEKPTGFRAAEGGGVELLSKAGARRYDGAFVFRASMPLHLLLDGLRTRDGFIDVDRLMRTSVPGVFAAGDCTGKPLQVAKAVGEGNIAAISAVEYLTQNG